MASRGRHNAYEGKGCAPPHLFLSEMAVMAAMFATAAHARAIMEANDRDKLSATVRRISLSTLG